MGLFLLYFVYSFVLLFFDVFEMLHLEHFSTTLSYFNVPEFCFSCNDFYQPQYIWGHLLYLKYNIITYVKYNKYVSISVYPSNIEDSILQIPDGNFY